MATICHAQSDSDGRGFEVHLFRQLPAISVAAIDCAVAMSYIQ
jgi:hypothetical protein